VAVLGTCAALVAMLAPAAGAFEPRRLVTPPEPLDLVQPSPLPRLAAWAQQGDVEMFRRTGPAVRLHLVSLVDFDGENWRAVAGYRPVGSVQQGDLPAGRQRDSVRVAVTVSNLDGPWLPAPGVPTTVSIADAGLDPDSGSLVIGQGLHAGLHYDVRGLVDTPTDADLAAAGVPAPRRYLALPRPPYLFDEYAHTIVSGASTPFEQAVLIETAVRENRKLDAGAPVGSSYARLETFLFQPASMPGGQAGTSEQFATAFAVLARAVGLPTRVTVGFRAGERQPDGTWIVRARDALAWPEVYFTGRGWVPFDPTPAGQDQAGPTEDTKRQVLDRLGASPLPTPSTRPSAALPLAAPAPSSASPRPPAAAPASWRPLLTGSAVLASVGVILVLALLLSARALRRLRHRRAGPRGAWSEVLDLLVLLGRPAQRWHTASNTAAELAHHVPVSGTHPASRLAQIADRAAFAPDPEPSPSTDAWTQLRALRRAVRRKVPLYRRLTWPVDPRPLRRRR
jgi:hypothetical protein